MKHAACELRGTPLQHIDQLWLVWWRKQLTTPLHLSKHYIYSSCSSPFHDCIKTPPPLVTSIGSPVHNLTPPLLTEVIPSKPWGRAAESIFASSANLSLTSSTQSSSSATRRPSPPYASLVSSYASTSTPFAVGNSAGTCGTSQNSSPWWRLRSTTAVTQAPFHKLPYITGEGRRYHCLVFGLQCPSTRPTLRLLLWRPRIQWRGRASFRIWTTVVVQPTIHWTSVRARSSSST